MYQRVGTPGGGTEPGACDAGAGEWIRHLLERLLTQPRISPEFSSLHYTFLAQMGHREDFRRRLATLYETWRGQMAAGLAEERGPRREPPEVSPRAVATLVQALLHGLGMQRAVDPDAFDPAEMLALCRDVLGRYLRVPPRRRGAPAAARKTHTNGSSPRRGARHHPRSREREP